MLLKVVVVLLLTEFWEVLLPSVNVVIAVVVISSVLITVTLLLKCFNGALQSRVET